MQNWEGYLGGGDCNCNSTVYIIHAKKNNIVLWKIYDRWYVSSVRDLCISKYFKLFTWSAQADIYVVLLDIDNTGNSSYVRDVILFLLHCLHCAFKQIYVVLYFVTYIDDGWNTLLIDAVFISSTLFTRSAQVDLHSPFGHPSTLPICIRQISPIEITFHLLSNYYLIYYLFY